MSDISIATLAKSDAVPIKAKPYVDLSSPVGAHIMDNDTAKQLILFMHQYIKTSGPGKNTHKTNNQKASQPDLDHTSKTWLPLRSHPGRPYETSYPGPSENKNNPIRESIFRTWRACDLEENPSNTT